MFLKRKILTFSIFILVSLCANAQKEQDRYTYEFYGGVNFHTMGGLIGGLTGKLGRKITKSRIRLIMLDIVEIKDDREQKFASFITGNSFIYGKQNHLFTFRPQYGQEFVLFRKHPEDGVRVTTHLAGGISFGLQKPYFVEYDFSTDSNEDIQIVPFNPDIHDPGKVLGGGYFFRGWGKTKIIPGINFRASLNFEYSNIPPDSDEPSQFNVKQGIGGIEAGFILDLYSQDIELLAYSGHKKLYMGAFVVFYYGKRW